MYDVIIVGAGPAGLTAGMYAGRRAMKTLILSKDLGGQAARTSEIENYPGIDFTDGFDLMQKFRDQAEKHGAEITYAEVEGLEKTETGFKIKTPHEEFEAKSVILAFGLTPKDIGALGEERLKGRGVSYCATCDGPLFKGKKVVVVGGGPNALDASEFLAKVATEVHTVYEREAFRALKPLVEKVMADQKIVKHFKSKVVEVRGEDRVSSVVLDTGEEIACDGVFVEIGYVAKTDWLTGLVETDDHHQIKTSKKCHTNVEGIFACGDITEEDYKQLVISAGEGAKAALEAYRYVNHSENKLIIPDWGFVKE